MERKKKRQKTRRSREGENLIHSWMNNPLPLGEGPG